MASLRQGLTNFYARAFKQRPRARLQLFPTCVCEPAKGFHEVSINHASKSQIIAEAGLKFSVFNASCSFYFKQDFITSQIGLRQKSFMPYRVTFIRAIKKLTIFRKNLGLFVRWAGPLGSSPVSFQVYTKPLPGCERSLPAWVKNTTSESSF